MYFYHRAYCSMVKTIIWIVLKMRTRETDLTKGPLLKQIILFAIPIILVNVIQNLFNTADTIVLGNFVDEKIATTAVAAVGSTTPLINLIIGFFVGISLGANVVIARCVGSGDVDKARKSVGVSILLSLISGLIIMVIGLIGTRRFLILMNCEAELLDMAERYLFIYFLGMPFMMLYNFSASVLRAVGDTLRPLIFLIAGGVLNVGLNIFSVTALGLDVEGVAIATVASNAFSAIACLVVLIKSNGFGRLELKNLRFFKEQIKTTLYIGIPSGLQRVFFSISNVILQSTINSFGELATAGTAVAHTLDMYISEVIAAFSITAMSFISQNLGAKNLPRIKRTVFLSLTLGALSAFILGGLMFVFYKPLCLMIRNDESILDYARMRMLFVAMFFFIGAMQNIFGHVLRGLGKSLTAMIVSLFSGCVLRIIWFKVVEVLFPGNLVAVLLSYSVTWAIGTLIYMVIFIPTFAKLKKEINQSIKY